jgi:hypothetical protein
MEDKRPATTWYRPPGNEASYCTRARLRHWSSANSHDTDTQQRLWAESERLTGVTYQFATTAGLSCRHPKKHPLDRDVSGKGRHLARHRSGAHRCHLPDVARRFRQCGAEVHAPSMSRRLN